ncbi:rhamnogalacturonan acetylesterase [uncultured Prevotella sp.]|jgi:lysophospholipase L1-like esterase|uniref:rhamnogalacturonan acetylesterase n=1 Tax=uncultured Prevotella sp. TaxID=159272 RepID=UPI00265D2690|nr:rhamnogalacturonan acetylesterase [uncultured Prevotella sp.]
MGRIKYFLVLLLCVLSLSAYKKNEKITIFMIGDSTMANKDISGGKMERGWGMMLKNFFTEDVIVDNHALNGRSSKSFISEGHWQKVVKKIKPGDYVFIQFGHNDEKDDPKRHTDPGTTFDENLRKFVKETRMRGGIPVLFNSVVRRIFTNSTTAVADDDTRSNSSADLIEGDTLVDTHGDYLLSPRNVARELNVPFVDANKITHDLEQGLGPDKSKKLHMWYLPNEVPSLPKGRQDNTHYNVYGAYVVAGLLADAVSDAVPELKQYRCKYDASVARDGSGLYFDLQTAVENVPSGVKTTILVGEGKWKKPVAGKDKKIEYIMRQGASFIK